MTNRHHPSTPQTVNKLKFVALTFVIFGATVLALAGLDLLPNGSQSTPRVAESRSSVTMVLPERIEIPKLSLQANVSNPTTTDVAILDKELLYGAVRYPTSGSLGAPGKNVVVFGHSSYLPVVRNPAYKTFDGIQNLLAGDKILIMGAGTTYVYEVETVASANANRDGIPLTVEGSKLTLVTCDSFATKSDRFVVTAHLVNSYPAST